MNRIQRCQAALAGRAVDRVPTYCPAIACEVASQILGRKAFGGTTSLHWAEVLAWSQGPKAHEDFEQQLILDISDLARALDLDVILMPWRLNLAPTRAIDQYTFLFGDPQGAHTIHRYEPQSGQFAMVERRGFAEVDPVDRLIQQVKQMEADTPSLPARVARMMADYLKLHQLWGRDYFHIGMHGGISIGIQEEDLIALALAPQWMARKILCQARQTMLVADILAASACPKVIVGGGDLAGNTGPMYSPQAFHDVVLPGYRLAVHHANWAGVHYMFRTDGNIWSIADMLFQDAGCPGFGEADRDAGMSVKALRQRYPSLVIWGNISSHFLQHATPQQVRDQARRHLDEAGGMRFFQGCSNAIVRGTSPDNVLALMQVRS